jgi:hypothetical protein
LRAGLCLLGWSNKRWGRPRGRGEHFRFQGAKFPKLRVELLAEILTGWIYRIVEFPAESVRGLFELSRCLADAAGNDRKLLRSEENQSDNKDYDDFSDTYAHNAAQLC